MTQKYAKRAKTLYMAYDHTAKLRKRNNERDQARTQGGGDWGLNPPFGIFYVCILEETPPPFVFFYLFF